jgi:AraC-like DNA-binding protein
MLTNNYFEKLNFNSGKKIIVSKKIDINFSDTMHWHPYVEILISLYDNNEVMINFTKYLLKTNDLVIIYPGDLHSFNHVSENAFIIVQFPLDLLMIMSEFNSNYSVFYQYHYIKYDPSNIDADKMILLIKELPGLFYSEALFNEVLIYSHLLEFFVKLGQYCVNAKKEEFSDDASTDYKATRLMTEACLYISQSCTKPLTLDDVSRHVGVSKSHFSHLFKKYTNMTFIDFLTTERIKRAEALIANPKAHIIDIAFDSGFSSVSSFNRAFKKIKGISPSEFRETMINN